MWKMLSTHQNWNTLLNSSLALAHLDNLFQQDLHKNKIQKKKKSRALFPSKNLQIISEGKECIEPVLNFCSLGYEPISNYFMSTPIQGHLTLAIKLSEVERG